jgi:hypothetical protein
MKKYYGNYLGLVVNGSYADPENRNRLQIWVPHVTNTLYLNWNSGNENGFENKSIFDISNGALDTNFLNRIRSSLPWAECASPLIGRGSTYYRNEGTGTQSTDPSDGMLPDEPGLLDSIEPPLPDFDAPDTVPSETPINFPSQQSGNNSRAQSDFDNSPPIQQSPAANINGDVSTDVDRPLSPPIVNNFAGLERFAKNSARGRCISDGSTGQCLKGSSVWAYALTQDERLNKPTGGSAQDIRLGTNRFFQNSGLYRESEPFNSATYTPVIGDQVLGKNHIITYLGLNSSGKQIWYSDFKDSSPFAYIESGKWNPNDMIYIRLNPDGQKKVTDAKYVNETYFADAESYENNKSYSVGESSPSQPNYAYSGNAANSNGGYDGTATGTYSSPDVGAKVWVFFMGGDIQKPIYFAMSLNSANYQQTYQSSQPT